MTADPRTARFLALALSVCALAAWSFAGPFGHELLAEIAALAIFAMSLDLLVGVTGMVSLGHAAYLGIGAYTTAVLTVFLGWPALPAMALSMAAAGAAALIVGVFVVRLGGIAFMMLTLAIGQMAHAYFFRNRALGGDDGLGGTPRPDLATVGLDLADAATFSAYALLLAAAAYAALALVVRSPFGHALGGIRQNERRMRALGCNVRGHKLAAYAAAAAGAGLAGSLLAQQSGFVSPELMFWTVSGEALIMVIVGGMGSIVGAAAGAAAIVLLRDTLSSLTEFWLLGMGLFFIVVVAFAREGIHGAVASLLRRLGGLRAARRSLGNRDA